MNPHDCIFFVLSKASQAGIRFLGQKTANLGVRPIQGLVLMALLLEDRITSRQLGELVDLDSATITGILDRLEGLEFIQRKPNPNDRRAILIELTDKGRETARELEAIIPQANQEFLEGFSAEEQMMLKGLLNRARKR